MDSRNSNNSDFNKLNNNSSNNSDYNEPMSLHSREEESSSEDQASSERLEKRRISRNKKVKIDNLNEKEQKHPANYFHSNGKFIPSKSETNLIELYKDILNGFEGAAHQSGLPLNKMSSAEAACFKAITRDDPINQCDFVYIRNYILHMWMEDPKEQLVFENVLRTIEPPFNSDPNLVKRIHTFLERHGFINFGIFKRLTPIPMRKLAKVIIVGAGISGLAAAQQLQQFGMNVIVLEARDRVGGRIATFRKNNYIADLGAMVVNGIWGNPMTIISKQIGMEMIPIRQKCSIYGPTYKIVPKQKDKIIEDGFKKLLEIVGYLSKKLASDYPCENPKSLGEALEWVIKLEERNVKEKQVEHLTNVLAVQSEIFENEIKKSEILERLHQLQDRHKNLIESRPPRNGENDKNWIAHEFKIKSTIFDWKKLRNEMDIIERYSESLNDKLNEIENSRPSDVYLSPDDRLILDWHFANIEFSSGAPLSLLSLEHWDRENEFEFVGNHTTLRNGYSCVPIALTEGIEVRLNTAVKAINYSQNGVEITTEDLKLNKSCVTYKADLVLCTLTLGVLKLATSTEKSNQLNKVDFNPPLPNWKTDAIQRLGFGNLNKVVLCFNKVFWNSDSNLFGHIGSTTANRGEFFLFWSISNSAVLLALIAGDSAAIMENVSDDVIVGRCIAVLKGIFGNNNVPQPKETVVTRWRSDPWARGSFSYQSVGSSSSDYDLLAAPVTPTNLNGSAEENIKKIPRLFFAGEHTTRNNAGTVHGAFLSGLREAGRITEYYSKFKYRSACNDFQ